MVRQEAKLSLGRVDVQIILGRNVAARLRDNAGKPPTLKESVGFGVRSGLVSTENCVTATTKK